MTQPQNPNEPQKPIIDFEGDTGQTPPQQPPVNPQPKPQVNPQPRNIPPINDTASVFNALSLLAKSKKREVILPLMKKRIITTQLLVGDDVALRTSMMSPDLYEREITKLVYNHIEFIDPSSGQSLPKPNFEQFLKELSLIDRQVAIWGILNSSYDIIGKDIEITCPYCNNKFKDTIKYDEVFQEDTLTLWDKPIDFLEDRLEEKVNVNIDQIKEIIFVLKIPTVYDRIRLMNLLGLDNVKENFRKLGTPFTDRDNLTLLTAKLIVTTPAQTFELNHMQDIHMAYTSYIPHAMAKNVLQKYNESYSKYVPNFRKPYKCGNESCGKDFDYVVDPEISLYQAFFE